MRFIIATLTLLAITACSKPAPPVPKNEFLIQADKITVHGNLNAGATVPLAKAEAAVKLSVQMLEQKK